MAGTLAICSLLVAWGAAAPSGESSAAGDKQQLAPLQAYVGALRGVGMPKRGSNAGAWTEASAWSWQFENGGAQLVGRLEDARFFGTLELQAGKEPGTFVLLASPLAGDEAGGVEADDAQPPRRFTGQLEDDVLVLTADGAPSGQPARVTIRLVAGGDRMVVLYEKHTGGDLYARLAEVGSTRKGSSFAKNAAAGPECVVTGGLGTIAVEYEGKTYYVCCSGCQELFEEDPAAALAEYHERKAAEKKQAEASP